MCVCVCVLLLLVCVFECSSHVYTHARCLLSPRHTSDTHTHTHKPFWENMRLFALTRTFAHPICAVSSPQQHRDSFGFRTKGLSAVHFATHVVRYLYSHSQHVLTRNSHVRIFPSHTHITQLRDTRLLFVHADQLGHHPRRRKVYNRLPTTKGHTACAFRTHQSPP